MNALLLVFFLAQAEAEILPLLNPNTATKEELMAVDKAITSEVADKIIKGRPYSSHDAVRKVIGEELYKKVWNMPVGAPPSPAPKMKLPLREKFDHQPLPRQKDLARPVRSESSSVSG